MKLPILSICIPTYNRAELLKSSLLSLVPQINDTDGKVELIISDNHSTDNTKQVVETSQKKCTIRYHVNNQNVGAARNILILVDELARGDYCWVLGDDDFIRHDGINIVIDRIEKNPDIEYFYVNYSIHKLINSNNNDIIVDNYNTNVVTGNPNLLDKHLLWEQLLREDRNCLTPIYCSVFKTSVWKKTSHKIRIGEAFSSLDSTYPHTKIFAQNMVGKRVYRIGNPVIVVFKILFWEEYTPIVILLRFHELLNFMKSMGVSEQYLDCHRRKMLAKAGNSIIRITSDSKTYGSNEFSLIKYIYKYCVYQEVWITLFHIFPLYIKQIIKKYALILLRH